jgi:hypothetical protein
VGTLNVGRVVNNPRLAEAFVIQRFNASGFVRGGWQQGPPTPIAALGVISIAKSKDLEMLPEGDRNTEHIFVWSSTEMRGTNATTGAPDGQTSDIILWQGGQYRVGNVWNYSTRGYYKALAKRLMGN